MKKLGGGSAEEGGERGDHELDPLRQEYAASEVRFVVPAECRCLNDDGRRDGTKR